MRSKRSIRSFLLVLLLHWGGYAAAQERVITFCGEQIPVDNSFVAHKLMRVIKSQLPQVNLPELRRKAQQYFPIIEYYLRAANLPQDLKYIPIVESGFTNATSKAGAQGFWQLMEPTAREWGLIVDVGRLDERNDPYKATIAACRELSRLYQMIRKDYKVSSWVLSAAAYNYGIGNIYRKIRAEGKDYFTMNLNAETAVYVYKIIAVKELFEYPELYMRYFRYNVFSTKSKQPKIKPIDNSEDTTIFQSVQVQVRTDDGAHPWDIDDKKIEKIRKPSSADLEARKEEEFKNVRLVSARIRGKYAGFKDGDPVTVELQENLQARNRLQRGGTTIRGRGWIINDRVYIDLGFDDHEVILYDSGSVQGVSLSGLKDSQQLILKVQN